MKKEKYFVCNDCGFESQKWFAKCPSCNSIGSAVEFAADIDSIHSEDISASEIKRLDDNVKVPERIVINNNEINSFMNGGLVKGAVYILSGEPGIGKSTFVSQLIDMISKSTLYISGEESSDQVLRRFKRMNIKNKNIGFVFETNVEKIINILEKEKNNFDIVVIDSVQTLRSGDSDSLPGSVLQVRESSRKLTEYVKENNISLIMIGHVNKEGAIAGPKILEHMVDCVLQLELEKSSGLRLLRVTKNRYGSTDEVVLFEMTQTGLNIIEDISKYFISEYSNEPGNVICIIKEGNKLFPIEIQALVSNPVYGSPRRVTSGIPIDRLNMITAVLSKKLKLPVESKDIFINSSGGIKFNDSSADLAIAFSVISSLLDIKTEKPAVCFGEVGLDGNIRNINLLEKRIDFSKRLGFELIISPDSSGKFDVYRANNIRDLLRLFEGE